MSRNFLNILQSHYPERLGRAYVINIPFLLNAFFKFIMPLVDPVTRDKVRFNPKVVQDGLIDNDKLLNVHGWGGGVDFEFKHEVYWKSMIGACNARREEQMKRWRELGGKIGEEEWSIKGGSTGSLPEAATTTKPEAVTTTTTESSVAEKLDVPATKLTVEPVQA
ncbi:hypothetical protein FRC17_006765 [Serendipita sp. 399]|nr:hypothetical protein FRC17_006765 [Serendipita sp. 399]